MFNNYSSCRKKNALIRNYEAQSFDCVYENIYSSFRSPYRINTFTRVNDASPNFSK
jgi:hypothetical protein